MSAIKYYLKNSISLEKVCEIFNYKNNHYQDVMNAMN